MKHLHRPKYSLATDGLFEYRSLEKKKLKICMAITATAMILEIWGGFFTNSLSLLSDAGHMFTHFFALFISFGAIVCAGLKSCHHRTFGFYRAEILAALFNSIFLFAVTVWIIIEGIKRLIQPASVMGPQMFIIALIGLVVNLLSVFVLRGAGEHDLNIKGVFLHMLADTFSSIAIVIGALIIYFTGWTIVDPILSIGIALLIVIWALSLLRDSVNILLEAAPKGINSDDVSRVLKGEINEIEEITDIHLWTITSKMHSMTAHIKLKAGFQDGDKGELLNRIKQIVNKRFDIEHTTIEFER